MTDDEDVRAQLQRIATRRRLAAAEQRAATVELRRAIERARDEGITVAEIARLSELSRQGVYSVMREPEQP